MRLRRALRPHVFGAKTRHVLLRERAGSVARTAKTRIITNSLDSGHRVYVPSRRFRPWKRVQIPVKS